MVKLEYLHVTKSNSDESIIFLFHSFMVLIDKSYHSVNSGTFQVPDRRRSSCTVQTQTRKGKTGRYTI